MMLLSALGNVVRGLADGASQAIQQFEITSELVSPVTNAINSGLTTLVPIGVGIMGVMIGINLIPRIIYKFL